MEHRSDRRKSAVAAISAFGLPDVVVYTALKNTDPVVSNAMTHISALADGYRLIFEDDVYFDGSISDLTESIKQLPEGWDLLYLGGNVITEQKKVSEKLNTCTQAWGSFAIMFSDSGAEKVLRSYQTGIIYDEWLRVASMNGKLNSYICSPPLAWTAPGFSDVSRRVVDYEKELRDNAKKHLK